MVQMISVIFRNPMCQAVVGSFKISLLKEGN